MPVPRSIVNSTASEFVSAIDHNFRSIDERFSWIENVLGVRIPDNGAHSTWSYPTPSWNYSNDRSYSGKIAQMEQQLQGLSEKTLVLAIELERTRAELQDYKLRDADLPVVPGDFEQYASGVNAMLNEQDKFDLLMASVPNDPETTAVSDDVLAQEEI